MSLTLCGNESEDLGGLGSGPAVDHAQLDNEQLDIPFDELTDGSEREYHGKSSLVVSGSVETSGGAAATTSASAADTKNPTTIAVHETKSVGRTKLAVLVVLVGSAIGVALTTYLYLSSLEERQFRREFSDDAHKVFDAVGRSLDRTLGLLDSIAVAYVSYEQSSNETWPFVSLPHASLRMAKVLPLSDCITLNVMPIVKPQQRQEWEAYSVAHDGWVDESMMIQESWESYNGPIVYNGPPNPTIHGDFGGIPEDIGRNLLPAWQNFPVIANHSYTYNWDWLSSSSARSREGCLKTHRAVIGAPFMLPEPGDTVEQEETEIWADFYRNFISQSENANEPVSDFTHPIINETNRVTVAGAHDYDPDQSTIVGVIVAEFYWRSMFRDILPNDSNGIQVVIRNPCSHSFTYQINGFGTEYKGVGANHEKKYDKDGLLRNLRDLSTVARNNTAYSGAKLDDEYCQISLTLYPSDQMRERFVSSSPAIFTFGVVLIFAFTLVVFYLFERNVERRQETVMNTAVQSSAIVSDLFPASVRDRLYPVAPVADAHRSKQGATMATSSSDSPIAELYQDTTVLFADLAGFTSWSSTRQPTQVFTLLETLYGAFDAIAQQHGVFKIETIGDCYVAVVGLPTPRAHHAIVMARFASDCRKKMRALTVELETTLGVGTADLAMRIGLNSGPTTAGVLRGEKSRFQLFGDTVNTAARMESNGERNKIHVSETTAELIKHGGKGHWLTQREGQIEAKGKGKLTTFWCEPSADQSMAGSVNEAHVTIN